MEEQLDECETLADELAATPKGHWPSTLLLLIDVLAAHFKRRERNRDNPEDSAARVTLVIADYLGGRQLYMPRGDRLRKAIQNVEIFRAHTGDNTIELAQRYGITERSVQRIVLVQRELARKLRREGNGQ